MKGQKVFNLSLLIIGAFIIVTLGIVVYSEWPLSWQGDRDGIDRFYDFFEYPIKAAGAAILIYTLMLSYQRMIQGRNQLELGNKQLLMAQSANFLNNFLKIAETFEEGKYLKIELEPNVYRFFPHLDKGDLRIDERLLMQFDKLKSLINTIAEGSSNILIDSGLVLLESFTIAGELEDELHEIEFAPSVTERNNFVWLRNIGVRTTKDLIRFYGFLSILSPSITPAEINELNARLKYYEGWLDSRPEFIKSLEEGSSPGTVSQKWVDTYVALFKFLWNNHKNVQGYGDFNALNLTLSKQQEKEYQLLHSSFDGRWGDNIRFNQTSGFRELLSMTYKPLQSFK